MSSLLNPWVVEVVEADGSSVILNLMNTSTEEIRERKFSVNELGVLFELIEEVGNDGKRTVDVYTLQLGIKALKKKIIELESPIQPLPPGKPRL